MAKPKNMTELLDILLEQSHKKDTTIPLSDIVETLNSKGFGVLLIGLALLLILPTGAIPGVPILITIFIFLTAGQILIGRSTLWLPKKITSYKVKTKKLESSINAAKKYTPKIDSVFKRRWIFFKKRKLEIVIALLSLFVAITIPFLGLIPLLVIIPATSILMFGIALTQKDGMILILGIIIAMACLLLIPTSLNILDKVF